MKAIFFDLDNTLYDSTIYFSSAFEQIASYLSHRFSLPKNLILDTLWNVLHQKGSLYPKLFDDTLMALRLQPDNNLLRELVRIFHKAPTDSLVLYEDAQEVLPRLARKYNVGLITNGNSKMQQRKVVALGLEKLMTVIVYTESINSPKPDPNAYKYAVKAVAASPQDCLYVGDNPHVDFVGAKCVGMWTVRILRGEFATIQMNREYIDAEICNFYELEHWLQRLETGGDTK